MKIIYLNKCPVFFKKVFLRIQCGYRKGYYTELCLSAPLKKWETSVHGGIAFGTLLTGLSGAFDCLDQKFIIAKLSSYGFIWIDIKSVHSYLPDRKQRAKMKNSYNNWLAIMFGAHQGSLLRPLLNNVFFAS